MSDTTNLNDLPINNDVPPQKTPDFSKSANEQIIEKEETGLPSKHIPTNTMHQEHVMDNEIVERAILERERLKDAEIYSLSQNAVKSLKKNDTKSSILNIETLLEPILYGLLYFFFQLPLFKETIKKYIQYGYLEDGNLNLYGYLSYSVLFGLMVYGVRYIKEEYL